MPGRENGNPQNDSRKFFRIERHEFPDRKGPLNAQQVVESRPPPGPLLSAVRTRGQMLPDKSLELTDLPSFIYFIPVTYALFLSCSHLLGIRRRGGRCVISRAYRTGSPACFGNLLTCPSLLTQTHHPLPPVLPLAGLITLSPAPSVCLSLLSPVGIWLCQHRVCSPVPGGAPAI